MKHNKLSQECVRVWKAFAVSTAWYTIAAYSLVNKITDVYITVIVLVSEACWGYSSFVIDIAKIDSTINQEVHKLFTATTVNPQESDIVMIHIGV